MSARVEKFDPLASSGDDRVIGRFIVVALLSLATQALVAGGFAVNASLADKRAVETRVTMVEITVPDEPKLPEPPPPPPPEPPKPEPPKEEPKPLKQPPKVEPPKPTEPQAAPEPPPNMPPPPPEPVRPRQIGMTGESFAGTGSGPRFAAGDTTRGGRPSRISVDPKDGRKPVDSLPAAPAGTGDKPAVPDRDASLKGRPDFNRYGYPDAAQKQLVEGDCRISLRVGGDGKVATIASIDCTRKNVGFEDYLRRYIPREMRFRPAIRGGIAAETEVVFTHEFRLPGR
jgi:protein TonB